MYFIEGCSSPNSSSGDGASLKTLRGMRKWNTPEDIEISEFMRLRKMIIILINNNNFNCIAFFQNKSTKNPIKEPPPKNQVVMLVRIIKKKIKYN